MGGDVGGVWGEAGDAADCAGFALPVVFAEVWICGGVGSRAGGRVAGNDAGDGDPGDAGVYGDGAGLVLLLGWRPGVGLVSFGVVAEPGTCSSLLAVAPGVASWFRDGFVWGGFGAWHLFLVASSCASGGVLGARHRCRVGFVWGGLRCRSLAPVPPVLRCWFWRLTPISICDATYRWRSRLRRLSRGRTYSTSGRHRPGGWRR